MPAIGVMTTTFSSAARMMAGILGMPDYAFAVIEHPVSSASDAALAERARITIAQLPGLLLAKA